MGKTNWSAGSRRNNKLAASVRRRRGSHGSGCTTAATGGFRQPPSPPVLIGLVLGKGCKGTLELCSASSCEAPGRSRRAMVRSSMPYSIQLLEVILIDSRNPVRDGIVRRPANLVSCGIVSNVVRCANVLNCAVTVVSQQPRQLNLEL